MSWSYEKTGTPDAVIRDASDYFDKTAKSYDQTPEGADVLACKERVIALVNACDLRDGANAVTVKANGSHYSTGPGKIGNAPQRGSKTGASKLTHMRASPETR